MEQAEVARKFKSWIEQKPGLDPYNYSSRSQMNGEYRRIAQQKDRALQALDLFWDLPYSEEYMHEAMRSFSGRLQFDDKGELTYCTGQYWPTEYRLAAAVVLESYIWECAKWDIEAAKTVLKHYHPNAYHLMTYHVPLLGEQYRKLPQRSDPVWYEQIKPIWNEAERLTKGIEPTYCALMTLIENYQPA